MPEIVSPCRKALNNTSVFQRQVLKYGPLNCETLSNGNISQVLELESRLKYFSSLCRLQFSAKVQNRRTANRIVKQISTIENRYCMGKHCPVKMQTLENKTKFSLLKQRFAYLSRKQVLLDTIQQGVEFVVPGIHEITSHLLIRARIR